MLNNIILQSLRNRWMVLGASMILLIVGTLTALRIEVDVFPDLNAPTVVVMTEAAGLAPEEVERLVTFPIETSVNGATDVRRVRSSSTTGFSVVWVEFDWGTDIYRARQIVSEKLAMTKDALPPGTGTPTLGPQSSILGEMMIVSLTADSTSARDLRSLADRVLRPHLLATGGVAQVAVLGGELKEYQILLNPARMRHRGVTFDEVRTAVEGMNLNVGGGVLNEFDNEYIVRTLLATTNVEELAQGVIKTTEGGTPIRLSDVAEVKVGNHAPKMGEASYNARPAVLLTVTKQPAAATIDLTERIDQRLEELKTSLPADVKISTDAYRQSRFIESSIRNVQQALLEGGIFVIVVLFIFLMNVRTTLISLVTIPIALLTAILALKGMGLTINTMSLGGMCIAIGSLVDDAIVDVENVFKHLRYNRSLPAEERKSVMEVTFEASREIRLPILNSTLIIIAGFVPLFFLDGIEGRMLAPLGIAFIVSLLASTVVALTLTPVLCSFLPAGKNVSEKELEEAYVARKLKEGYARALNAVLGRHRLVLGVTAAVFLVSLGAFFTLGRSFLPPFNEGSLTINLGTMPGVTLEESDRIGREAERLLLGVPEIQAVARKTGRAELDEHALGVNQSELEAPFVLSDRSKEAVMADVRQRLQTLPGLSIEVGAPITHRIDAMLSGTRAAVAIKLFGTDLNQMFALGNQIKAAVEEVEGVVDLNVEQQVERPQLKITPRREMLARYGIPLPEFAEQVATLLGGKAVSQVYEGNQAFDLVLRADETSRQSADAVRDLMLDAGGRAVPLGNVADITSSVGPNTINRENAVRKIVVSANVAGSDLRSVVEAMRERIEAEVALPEGYRVEYGGQFESEQSASRSLLASSLLAIAVIFLLLYRQFGSATQSLVILLNLPLALIGGVWAIVVSDGVMSIPSIIGFISLFGIATRNGILLVARYNDLMAEGLSPMEAVVRGSSDRLNPIIMTALTSGLALIPMVLGGDLPGNEIQSPMAIVILGGLFTSTFLNGFIIPLIFLLTHRQTPNAPEAVEELP